MSFGLLMWGLLAVVGYYFERNADIMEVVLFPRLQDELQSHYGNSNNVQTEQEVDVQGD